ncbi:hypothetical protein AwDysgo_19290 [Bacteroidales bacterium]|nr:hypothetical protein AwDysgo_19290 [Bacteroidales bacterium]
MKTLFSFIVPVYNTEKYVLRCLLSLVNQNIPASTYNIIVVIDGSLDNSQILITQFASNYSNIKIIVQENQGLSEARNNGLKASESEYVWFVDSDDWIAENCLRELLHVMQESELDMFEIAPSIPYQDDFARFFDSRSSVSNLQTGREYLLNKDFVVGAWAYLFRREFLIQNRLFFLPKVYFEDEEFTPRALYFAEKLMALKAFSVYSYFIRENSITTLVSDEIIFDKLKVANSLVCFMKNNVDDDNENLKKVFYGRAIGILFSGIKLICKQKKGFFFLNKYLQEASFYKLYPIQIRYIVRTKTKMLCCFLNFSSYMYYKLKS